MNIIAIFVGQPTICFLWYIGVLWPLYCLYLTGQKMYRFYKKRNQGNYISLTIFFLNFLKHFPINFQYLNLTFILYRNDNCTLTCQYSIFIQGGQLCNNFSHLYGEKLSAKCRHKTLAKALRVGRCKCETNFKTLLHKGLQFRILFYHRIMKQEAQSGSSEALNTTHVFTHL